MRKLPLLSLFLVACGTGSLVPVSESQKEIDDEAMKALVEDTQASWQGHADRAFATPAHLEALTRVAMPEAETRSASLLKLLARNPRLFRLENAARDLQIEREEEDELKMTHVRLRQFVHGVPVLHGEMLAHFGQDGDLKSLDAHISSQAENVSTTPTVTAEDALAKAKGIVQKELSDYEMRYETENTLVVHHDEGSSARLAYHVKLPVIGKDRLANFEVFVDAHTGEVFDSYDSIETATGSGLGVRRDTKTINISEVNGRYALLDGTRTPNGIRTFDCRNGTTLPGQLVVSNTMTDWDTNSRAPGAAVDAHFYLGVVYDYFKKNHGRAGIDGQDGQLLANVHFQQGLNNAFWDGRQMVFGDGDGTNFLPFSGSLHVIAHELTHGVTERTSGLVYKNQSGALNEAISDIFGVFVKHQFKPNPETDWLVGEDASVRGRAMRNMMKPTLGQQPANMSRYVQTTQDNGGVHINSGIPNNAAYLMTMGGTNETSNVKVAYGIGFTKAEKVWYRAATKYFTSTSNFQAAAQGTLSAAKDLNLTENEQNIIECSWIATGVLTGTCKTLTDPTPPSRAGDISVDAGAPTGPIGEPNSNNGGGGRTTSDGGTRSGSSVGNNADDGDDSPAPSGRRMRTVEQSACTLSSVGHTSTGSPWLFLGVLGLLAHGRATRRRA